MGPCVCILGLARFSWCAPMTGINLDKSGLGEGVPNHNSRTYKSLKHAISVPSSSLSPIIPKAKVAAGVVVVSFHFRMPSLSSRPLTALGWPRYQMSVISRKGQLSLGAGQMMECGGIAEATRGLQISTRLAPQNGRKA